ncbi:hypothetical protein [Brevibacillus sp. IT-7CA2]|uniref:hypothetical protein n=1 Tax=Brevibacillus sp. IT-7CA2 TaxID=3026436 RepID=UPI0039E129A6
MKLSGGFLCTLTTLMSGERGKRRLTPHDVASSKPKATRSLLGGHLPWMPCQMK